MKKFVVIIRRPALFNRKSNPVATFSYVYDHAVDAWRHAREAREEHRHDGRWAPLSVEVTFE